MSQQKRRYDTDGEGDSKYHLVELAECRARHVFSFGSLDRVTYGDLKLMDSFCYTYLKLQLRTAESGAHLLFYKLQVPSRGRDARGSVMAGADRRS